MSGWARSPGAAGLPSMDRRITVERRGDRLTVVIQRRQARTFDLSLDEGDYLRGLLAAELPPVTVRTIGADG